MYEHGLILLPTVTEENPRVHTLISVHHLGLNMTEKIAIPYFNRTGLLSESLINVSNIL